MKKVKSYRELKDEARKLHLLSVVEDVYKLEKSEPILNSKAEVENRLVRWWNEEGTQANPMMQRGSYVLMQAAKHAAHSRKLKKLMM